MRQEAEFIQNFLTSFATSDAGCPASQLLIEA